MSGISARIRCWAPLILSAQECRLEELPFLRSRYNHFNNCGNRVSGHCGGTTGDTRFWKAFATEKVFIEVGPGEFYCFPE
ncbi:MAG: hypothetical protein JRH07_17955 [Deltaproteobacteria bacterium]|nr:hypothetical protein [Deltaproteobacteria bacterium]